MAIGTSTSTGQKKRGTVLRMGVRVGRILSGQEPYTETNDSHQGMGKAPAYKRRRLKVNRQTAKTATKTPVKRPNFALYAQKPGGLPL